MHTHDKEQLRKTAHEAIDQLIDAAFSNDFIKEDGAFTIMLWHTIAPDYQRNSSRQIFSTMLAEGTDNTFHIEEIDHTQD